MFQWLIRFSVRHKAVVGILTVALIVWGVLSLVHLPFDATPDITSNQVQILTTAPSLGAQEVERQVTMPVEMAVANIPRVKERRSISRSGLSVITLVFDEGADIYWARSQVAQAVENLQNEFSARVDMELAPISTGVGEIYHYTVRPAPGYEDRYSAADIREIQDWIVRRGLTGTPGVAEVSGWGGFVREYEVKVDPQRLAGAGLNVADVAEALRNNNANTGGSYIEKNSNQYFIRGLGVAGSVEDIENIVVKSAGGVPLRVKDVADVGFGNATRYGAVTRNGEGEVVAGIALMLKGENFQEVSRNVKERLKEIKKTLPEGVVVEPFIDRTELVDRVTDTIARNLIEGGLIVIFILILFLGSWRSGLVVASVIPLAMLFAFGMMKLFGVSGNLMSLGAIDFGLIVDGAVIIVECVCLHINEFGKKYGAECLSRTAMDEEVILSASKIRNSAAFGEIIIMIVYLPLLTLSGIEGKMFRPMALTIFFAVLGAFILSLTYVPMASALFLSRKPRLKKNYSDRLMLGMQKLYTPLLNFCLRHAKALLIFMVLLFGGSVWLFTRLGGEFIPTLEEGDFAVEISMAQGTSLSQMVETTTLAERLIKENYPEVRQAVTRIGSAEIPTDPMPVERADMLISLIPKKEWTSARTKDELMAKMAKTLSLIPGMEAEMSQPVQMRNNELITGIRQDVAVMLYGPDLDVLTVKAEEIAGAIKGVKGITSPKVERVTGLPQIQVEYSRDLLGAYGLTVAEANAALEGAFAGEKSGVVMEGERSFDVVVRMDGDLRNDIEAVRNLPLHLPAGGSVPLRAVASVEYKDAPAQITREDGERRIYVGFNVSGRDVQSVVKEIQEIIDTEVELPSGYTLRYGGEFKNLQEATSRLSIAVPLALVLILLLLYATLRSVRETLMVSTAIPLALIGGVVALWVRGMPFSISAGVGFIALFGVAVLNGIVLMGQFNTFEKEGIKDIRKRIEMGCRLRLRPVIMTALVASFGFLPMALSHGDGAEVQRPLATVVIGGLLTATVLTLMVIPAIYKLFAKQSADAEK